MSRLSFLLIVFFFLAGAVHSQAQTKAGPWSLEDCINYALTHNPEVKESQLALETNKANQVQAKMGMLPIARLGASHAVNSGRSIDPYSNQPITQSFQSTDVGLNAGLTLFNGLQVQNSIRQFTLALQAGQEEVKNTQNTLSLQVALAYLAVLQNQELAVIADHQVATSKTQLERANKLVNSGAMAPATLADLQVQAGNDELDFINAKNNLRTAKLTLMQYLNLPVTAAFEIQPLSVNSLATSGYSEAPETIYSTAEKVQPSIIGADLRVRSARKGVQVARGILVPSLSLFGYMGSNYSSAVPTQRFVADGTTQEEVVTSKNEFITVKGSNYFISTRQEKQNGSFQDFYYLDQLNFNLRNAVGISLSVPILNGWQNRTRISNAVINRKRAEFLAQTSRIQLRQNIEQAYTELTAAQSRLQTSQKQAEATQIAYTAAQKRFENGSVHFVDLNLAKTNYDRAQLNLVRNKYDYVFRKKILDFYQNKPLTLME